MPYLHIPNQRPLVGLTDSKHDGLENNPSALSIAPPNSELSELTRPQQSPSWSSTIASSASNWLSKIKLANPIISVSAAVLCLTSKVAEAASANNTVAEAASANNTVTVANNPAKESANGFSHLALLVGIIPLTIASLLGFLVLSSKCCKNTSASPSHHNDLRSSNEDHRPPSYNELDHPPPPSYEQLDHPPSYNQFMTQRLEGQGQSEITLNVSSLSAGYNHQRQFDRLPTYEGA